MRQRYRLGAALLAATLLGPACGAGRTPAPALAVDEPEGLGTWGFAWRPREVVAVGLAPLHVLEPATFERVSLEVETGELQLLTARVSLLACSTCRVRSDLPSYPGYAGGACSQRPWPPASFGPTAPLEGFAVEPGDRPSVLVYARPKTETARTGAFVLAYRDSRGRSRTLRIANERIDVFPPKPGRSAVGCDESMWFGASDDPQLARVRPPKP